MPWHRCLRSTGSLAGYRRGRARSSHPRFKERVCMPITVLVGSGEVRPCAWGQLRAREVLVLKDSRFVNHTRPGHRRAGATKSFNLWSCGAE